MISRQLRPRDMHTLNAQIVKLSDRRLGRNAHDTRIALSTLLRQILPVSNEGNASLVPAAPCAKYPLTALTHMWCAVPQAVNSVQKDDHLCDLEMN